MSFSTRRVGLRKQTIPACIIPVLILLSACGGGDSSSGSPTAPRESPRATAITLSPSSPSMDALGATAQLTATVKDQFGATMGSATVTWGSSAAAVATVSATGLVTAVSNGTATVTATSGSASTSATVTVQQTAATIVLEPTSIALESVGETTSVTALVKDRLSNVIEGASVTWTSSDPAIVTVDASGLLTAVTNGAATITASSGSTSTTASVLVEQVATAIEVDPESVTLLVGETLGLTAAVEDGRGNMVEGASVTWTSSDETIVTVGTDGMITGQGPGMAEVKAESGTIEASVNVEVRVPLEIETEVLPAGFVGTFYTATLQVVGGADSHVWGIVSGSLTPGLSLSTQTGVLSGTPTAPGTSTFTVEVTSGAESDTKQFSLVVTRVGDPPTVTTGSLPVATVGFAFSTTLQASGGDGTYTWSVVGGSLPSGISLSPMGVMEGTTTFSGTSAFVARVTSAGKSNTANLSLTAVVSAAPAAPTVWIDVPASVAAGSSFTTVLHVAGPPATPQPVGALSVEIQWDPTTLGLGDWDDFSSNYFWTGVRWDNTGSLKVTLANVVGLPPSVVLLRIPFVSLGAPDNSVLTLGLLQSVSVVTYAEVQGQYLAVSAITPMR